MDKRTATITIEIEEDDKGIAIDMKVDDPTKTWAIPVALETIMETLAGAPGTSYEATKGDGTVSQRLGGLPVDISA